MGTEYHIFKPQRLEASRMLGNLLRWAVCYDSVLSKLPASNRMLIYQRFSGGLVLLANKRK